MPVDFCTQGCLWRKRSRRRERDRKRRKIFSSGYWIPKSSLNVDQNFSCTSLLPSSWAATLSSTFLIYTCMQTPLVFVLSYLFLSNLLSQREERWKEKVAYPVLILVYAVYARRGFVKIGILYRIEHLFKNASLHPFLNSSLSASLSLSLLPMKRLRKYFWCSEKFSKFHGKAIFYLLPVSVCCCCTVADGCRNQWSRHRIDRRLFFESREKRRMKVLPLDSEQLISQINSILPLIVSLCEYASNTSMYTSPRKTSIYPFLPDCFQSIPPAASLLLSSSRRGFRGRLPVNMATSISGKGRLAKHTHISW